MRVAKRKNRSQKKSQESPCAGAPNICTVAPSLPQKRANDEWFCTMVALLSNRAAPDYCLYRRAPESELSPSPREKKGLAREPIAVRSQSSSGNCPAHHTTQASHLPISHKTCARAGSTTFTREIRFIIIIVFSAPPLLGCAGLECLMHWVRSGAR